MKDVKKAPQMKVTIFDKDKNILQKITSKGLEMSIPFELKPQNLSANMTIFVGIYMSWSFYPLDARDYTLSVYSKHAVEITDLDTGLPN